MTTQNTLKSTIEDKSIFNIPTSQLLQLIKSEYTDELDRLKTAYAIPGQEVHSDTPSPSMILFDTEYDEINRTLVGVLALRWIYNKDYNAFVGSQAPETRLTRQSFDWIVEIFHNGIRNDSDLYVLITSMVINDLGKSESLIKDYQRLTNTDISTFNHDMILHRIIEHYPSLIPSLSHLTTPDKTLLLSGIKLGAEFNFGQLAQAENVPACLLGLQELKDDHNHDAARTFEIRFMEQLLDIAGAAGHIDHSHAKLNEPVFQSYKNVYDICRGIIDGNVGFRDGYDLNLTRKVDMLVKSGWERGQELDVQRPKDRALMRLLCIGRTADIIGAELISTTFTNLDKHSRCALIQGLNIDGTRTQPAVQATYIPAMCSAAIKNTRTGSEGEKEKALAAVFRYLARVLTVGSDTIENLPKGVVVIERDVRYALSHCVNTDRFRDDTDILDGMDIPGDAVAKMAS